MSENNQQNRDDFRPYSGYHQNWRGKCDTLLSHIGPGTPCGEYLRRYWHPVFISSELSDKPRLIQILGEELVLFRDNSGQLGLVHKKCPHRRASLEYGRCEHKGIRCCYHGWLFDVDGSILEIPGEPEGSPSAKNAMETRRLGAYPVLEFRGLIFAYLGPPEAKPAFPHYDVYDIPDLEMTPYAAPFNCNWVQVLDAIVDPVHTAFLHQNQFSDGFGKLGEVQFYERDKIRFLGTQSRRVGDNVWVRVNELILPNFTQSGAAFAVDGSNEKLFGRSAFTRWVVPVDDQHCIAYAWGNFGERGDPHEWNTPEGMQLIEQGELIDRTYEEKQQSPGDVEAVEGMGAISDHEKEFLVSGDKGIAMYRRKIRRLCRDLDNGKPLPQPAELGNGVVYTYGSDTVLRVPNQANGDDRQLLNQVNDQVMDLLFAADQQDPGNRDDFLFAELGKLY